MHADLSDVSLHLPVPAIAVELPTHEEIADRAFSLYEQRGFADGRDVEDWLDAERQLLLERLHTTDRYPRD